MGNETIKFKVAKWVFLKSIKFAWKQGMGSTWMQNQIKSL